MLRFTLNGQTVETDLAPDTLLWAVRDQFKLKGSTAAAQGSAVPAMHVDGVAQKPACPLGGGRRRDHHRRLGSAGVGAALQAAWVAESVSQCGYCQSGQIMAAAALLEATPTPPGRLETAMAGNICRRGCYPRIKNAIQTAAASLAQDALFTDAMAEDVRMSTLSRRFLRHSPCWGGLLVAFTLPGCSTPPSLPVPGNAGISCPMRSSSSPPMVRCTSTAPGTRWAGESPWPHHHRRRRPRYGPPAPHGRAGRRPPGLR